MKKKYVFALVLLILIAGVLAVTWTPQGNIDLKSYYNITKVSFICNTTNCYVLADFLAAAGGDGNASSICLGDQVLLGNTTCWSAANFFDDTTIGNCSTDGSCPLITYDSELSYTTDTSAHINCSTDEVFLGNGTCWSAANFFDDTTIADTNASTECSTDEILLGNTSCMDIVGTEWITPSEIIDVDDADIETDLNTYVDIAGDIMTGPLNMSVQNITTVNCIIFNSGGRICSGT